MNIREDALIKITACAICGSDLHLFDGYQPTMESGDVLGHENMGEVIELGSEAALSTDAGGFSQESVYSVRYGVN